MKIRLFFSYITYFIFGFVIAKDREEADNFINIIDDGPQMVP